MSREGSGLVLLEREHDLAEAASLLSDATRGHGCCLLIEGPAGIGKSALISELRLRAPTAGCAVLSARGGELERDFPFGVVRQLLEPALASVTPAERQALFAGAARLAEPAIGQLGVEGTTAPASASPSLDPSFAVLHGLYWLVANLSEGSPLLITVDDAHWADAASLRFLVYLTGRLLGLPVLLVVGLRRFEPDVPEALIAALAAEDASHAMRLSPLSEQGTDAMVRSRLGPVPARGFSAACHRVTRGNPQLIRELLAALAAEGIAATPEGAVHVANLRADRIAGSVLARVGRVGGPAVAVAQAVAVLGRFATLAVVAALAELDLEDAERAADALVALEVLLPGDQIAFVHPIVRRAVYADMGAARRAAAHARAARLLADRGAAPDAVVAQIMATPPGHDAWAVIQLQTAAQAALASGAPDAVVACLERVLQENPSRDQRREALVGLGWALFMLRDPRRSIRRLLDALELTDDPRQRAEIVDILVQGMLVSRAAARAVDLLDRAIAELPDSERDLGLRLESVLDSGSFFSLNAKRRAEHRRRRFADADDPRMLASAAMRAALYGGTADDVAALARRALGDGRLLHEGGPDSPPVWTAGFALIYAHQLHEAKALADTWIREAGERGSMRAYSLACSLRTRATYWAGELAEAEADARAFIDGMPEAVGLGPSYLADTLLDQGRPDEADAALALADRADSEVEWSFFYPSLLLTRGMVALAQGEPERGCTHLLHAGRLAAEWGVVTPGPLQWRPAAAEALISLGERDRAAALLEDELDECRRYGSARSLGIALRAAAKLETGAAAVSALEEAVRLLAASEARLEHARGLIELGIALRRARRIADARQPLREGLAAARACGARSLAELAHEELTATGARPRKIVRAGLDALTSSERRVAQMAAQGMHNKDIAQALFVTVRTVEAHLHHAYQKLDISSRDQLADALGGRDRTAATV